MKPLKPPTPASTAPTDEQKKAERLAKFEAWKQKQLAERERKQKEQAAAGGARSILDEIDKKTAARTQAAPAASQPQEATHTAKPRRFEPKEIAKKAAAPSTGSSPLGKDAAVPSNPNLSATSTHSAAETEANKTSATTTSYSGECFSINFFNFEHVTNVVSSLRCAIESPRKCQWV